MTYPKWAPIEIISYVKEHELRLTFQQECQADEKEVLQRDIEMWRRLITRPEMEALWKIINGNPEDEILMPRATEVLNQVGDIRKAYDAVDKISIKDYKQDLKEIADLASKLSKKLFKYNAASDENNPFLYRLLLANENLNVLSKVLKPKTYDPELRDLWWCGRPEHYIDHVLPSIDKLLKLLSDAAKEEMEGKKLRLNLPTKVRAETAFRTYFIKSIGFYLTRLCNQYSPSAIATFCSVALDDDTITADLAGKLFPQTEGIIPKPLTPAEISSAVEQIEEIQRIVRDICYPPSPPAE